jgi:hypothetical protein
MCTMNALVPFHNPRDASMLLQSSTGQKEQTVVLYHHNLAWLTSIDRMPKHEFNAAVDAHLQTQTHTHKHTRTSSRSDPAYASPRPRTAPSLQGITSGHAWYSTAM